MTFHVRYNDCHLEADMEREGERDRATEEKEERAKKMEGGAEGGRKKGGGGQSVDENGLGHLWFCPDSPNQPPLIPHS